jgi:anti-sigma factor RsiW
MTHAVHIPDELVAKAVDEELTIDERLFVERHLAACPTCRERRRQWAELSDRVQDCVLATEVSVSSLSRECLAASVGVEANASSAEVRRRRWILPRAGAVAAVACLVVLGSAGVFWKTGPWALTRTDPAANRAAAVDDIRWDNGDFIPLPYSADAVPGSERIVRVELPVSALAEQGILPAGALDSAAMYGDGWVLADLAVGLDGQPSGIRLVDETDVRN